MSEEIKNEQELEQDYEQPSLTDLEDVAGGSICATGGSAAAFDGVAGGAE